ncbi:MAG: acyltransferase family protein, partial [Halobacteriota archaeon]
WFIGVILLFYLIYPFVVSFSSTSKQLVLALLTPLLLFVVLRVAFNLVDFRFFVYYALFFGGVLASKYDVFNRYSVKPPSVVVSVLLLITGLVLIANMSLFDAQPHMFLYSGLDMSAPPLTTTSVLAIVLADILALIFVYTTFTLSRLILPSLSSTARKAIAGIAFSAYCVYLFHRPLLVLLADALNATHLVALQKDVLIIVCGIPLIFIVGYALQRGWNSLLAKATPQRQPHARRTVQIQIK